MIKFFYKTRYRVMNENEIEKHNKYAFENNIVKSLIIMLTFVIASCSNGIIQFSESNLEVINRDIEAIEKETNTVTLNAKLGDGLATIKDLNFDVGTIEIELKGENVPGKSFVGIAFNIQNDSTYEGVYFRPFNFQSKEKIRREHSLQYIYHPENSWRFLRTNFEGQYEAEFPRQPSPDNWFKVQIKIDDKKVYVYDVESNVELLSVERLTKQVSNKIALWTGHNSKGAFRNLKIIE
jgi:hypothetical protein